MGDLGVYRDTYCNPKGTNLESYQEDLKANIRGCIKSYTLGARCTAGY
jgi:hypothetical protein